MLTAGAEAPQAEPGPSGDGRARLELSIDTPEPGAVIGDPGGMAFLAGRAIALYGEYQTFDIVFVIDTSESTSGPSGADIDGDGEIGRPRGSPWLSALGRVLPFPLTDNDDTVLAAEIAAAEALLDQLDARTTRVGVVVFSGDTDPMTPDAYTEVPLTTDHDRVRRGLARVRERGPAGMTNMVSGINTAIVELLGTESAFSERREGSRRIILFLTDGFPTLPFEQSRRLNARAAIDRAKRARRANIRIDTFAIGEDALDEPISVVEMARVTGGIFTPVRSPQDLRAIFEEVSFAEIERLEIRNQTTGSSAAYRIQNADGSFSALVPMREGTNKLEVFARARDGSEARRTLNLRFLPDASIQALSPRLISQRNRLLENQLMDLQRRRLEIEEERDEQLRRELRVEIEQERKEATRRAEAAKKRLQIEVED